MLHIELDAPATAGTQEAHEPAARRWPAATAARPTTASTPSPTPAPASASADAATQAIRRWLCAALDELDYGIVVLDAALQVVHINDAARAEIASGHALVRDGGGLHARRPKDAAALHDAVAGASSRGLRRLLALGDDSVRSNLSVVPLDEPGPGGRRAVLVVFAKRAVSEALSIEGYARSHGLTGAETRVLVALCAGVQPLEAACRLGVAISTIRSQIGSIRAKTGTASIRMLVNQVALLPPVKGVLR